MDELYGSLIAEKLIDQQLAQNLWDAGFQQIESLLELPTNAKELQEMLRLDCPTLQKIGIAFSLVAAIKKLRIDTNGTHVDVDVKQDAEDRSVPDAVTARVQRIKNALDDSLRSIDALHEWTPIKKYAKSADELRLDVHGSAISALQERFESDLEPILQQFRSKIVDIAAINSVLDQYEEPLITQGKLQELNAFLQETCGFLQEFLLDEMEHEGIPIVDEATVTSTTIALTLNMGKAQDENFDVIKNFVDPSNPTEMFYWPKDAAFRQQFARVVADFTSLYRANKLTTTVDFVCILSSSDHSSSLNMCMMPVFVQLVDSKWNMLISLPMFVHPENIVTIEVTPSTMTLRWTVDSPHDNWIREDDDRRMQSLVKGFQVFAIGEGDAVERLVYQKKNDTDAQCLVQGLNHDTSYRFSIQIICDYDIQVARSEWSRPFRTKQEDRRPLRVKECAEQVPDRSTANIFHLSRKAIPLSNSGIQKFEIGANSPKEIGKKVLLVVGGTGTGKTTLINSMANYLYEVRPDDPFRFKLISEQDELKECGTADATKSQTKLVGAYVLNDTRLNYQLTVVDTPGFGDTEGGTAFDRQTVSYIKSWFSQRGPTGISQIDGICIVVKSTDVTINAHVRHELNSVVELFGKHMQQNILIMLTFSDNAKPPAIGALSRVGIPTERVFKFNNSAVFEKYVEVGSGSSIEEQDNAAIRKVFWDMGMKNFHEFFTQLDTVPSGSLCMSLQVLKIREMLEQQTLRLSERIKEELEHAKNISDTIESLVKNKAVIDRDHDFVVKLKQRRAVQRPVGDSDSCALTCLKCNFTCHKQCPLAEGLEIQWSVIMRRMIEPTKEQLLAEPAASSVAYVPSQEQIHAQTENATCTVCPAKCHWSTHTKCDYIIVYEEVDVEEKIIHMVKRYGIIVERGQSITQKLAEALARTFVEKEQELRQIVAEIRAGLNKLNDIDMTTEQMITDKEYLDTLVEGEKTAMTPGYQKRVVILERQMPILQLLDAAPAMKQTLPDIDTAALEYLHLEHPKLYEVKTSKEKEIETKARARLEARKKGEDSGGDDSDSGEKLSPMKSQLKFWREMGL